MTPFYIWMSIGIVLIMLEIFSATFFMLCAAVGAFLVALGWAIFDTGVDRYFLSTRFGWDALVFTVVSIVFMLFLPRWLKKSSANVAEIGLDATIGSKFNVVESKGNLMVKIQGQDWNLLDDENFKAGETVKVVKFVGSKVEVVKV